MSRADLISTDAELIKQDSEHPANISHSRASIGSVVIRLLKKDGTRSAKYVTPQFSWGGDGKQAFYNWFPDGMDMKGKP